MQSTGQVMKRLIIGVGCMYWWQSKGDKNTRSSKAQFEIIVDSIDAEDLLRNSV